MKHGFTLIEALVVLGILTILTSLLLLYNRSGEEQILLAREKAKIIAVILRAKSLSVATFVDEAPACGYGVHLTDSGYVLFKELANPCPGDQVYTPDEPAEFMENFTLDPRVKFVPLPVRNILFVPPEPQVYLDGSRTLGETKIGLAVPESKASVSLTIFGTGQVGAD